MISSKNMICNHISSCNFFLMITLPAGSEANSRRIAIVEQCFGNSGQVSKHVIDSKSC